ncbi:hypothetical protein HGRIS_008672 [Hohenbuehelia grisea]|uniref:Uncharacterized protein n=1 Tax=Hohenbuehelia grisea TaxID=104357 RepID=A0ABR3J8V8_9AGAR
MSYQSNVGNSQIHEANEQRTYPAGHDDPPRFEAGPERAHINNDSKDNRTLANRKEATEKAQHEEEVNPNPREVVDPLKPAQKHGNEPSRGAKIDAEIKEQEEEELRNKGKI